ncbi:MAG: PD40 domain-containing protein [Chloroflexi bacterium]|nr:PD40 domain-containing protein [Chloroflexota bacterium]
MSPKWLLVLAVPALVAIACGDGPSPSSTLTRLPTVKPSATPTVAPAAFSLGDWVEVVTAEGCLEVVIGPPGQYADLVTSCLPGGFVGLIVDGPDQAGGHTWWALAGWGWAPERSLRFHHSGGLPYPERPELADAGRIAFIGPDGDVWVVDGDGSGKLKLFELNDRYGNLVELQWSPDGSRLAIQSNNEFRAIVSTEGDPILEPGAGISFLGWSPTGENFAVARFPEDKREGIYLDVLDLEGNAIAEFPSLDLNTKPSFSPDGRRIVFSRSVGYMAADLQAPGAQPLVLEPDPASVLALSQPPPIWSPINLSLLAYGQLLIDLGTSERHPLPGDAVSWSLDGRFLLLADCHKPPIKGQIYDVEASTLVLEFDVFIGGTDAPCWQLVRGSWSPDGRHFLYLSPDDIDYPPRTYGLRAWDAATRQTSKIGAFRTVGQFSPDSQHVLFGSSPGVSRVFSWIWIMDIDGSGYTLLAEGDAPAWQPQP